MLIYLLLNKCEVDKIEKIIECKEDNKGATFVKMYGLTSEFIDTDKIYKEINDIQFRIDYVIADFVVGYFGGKFE